MCFFVSSNEVHWKEILQLLFLPTVSQTFILSWATNATRPCKFLFRKNNSMCLIETMLKPLPLVQNKARTEVNQTNPVQTNISIVKGLETSIIHVIEYQIEWDIFLKNIFWSKHFPATTNCKTWHSRVFLVKPVFYFINFPHEHYQYVSSNLELCLKKQFYRDVFLGNLRNFSNIYSQKLHILLCFFITDFANFIYSSPNLWN